MNFVRLKITSLFEGFYLAIPEDTEDSEDQRLKKEAFRVTDDLLKFLVHQDGCDLEDIDKKVFIVTLSKHSHHRLLFWQEESLSRRKMLKIEVIHH